MLAAVKENYNGSHIMMKADISLSAGQEVIETIPGTQSVPDRKHGKGKCFL